ncbi:aldose 1-epimerase family protein [Microbacterium sp. EYE_5]|uniref:aldose 1-epimerase family protein n=1 Tax=unclassified Microbacterium TaxID=2609290 RepID=UPI0020044594|nr:MULTISPECIES: aldose 1-epimerase family protein [unclassified Microbacterium]MCK6079322.1 aldose 1-epimerase family protein [Microbacterium sp. EYE_382]MCK6084592.1 aldose 1-epimerase family protein [Microbacterium sp. EYE_384]MCK6123179.1 aldose 1-epimerase family protein [Microbacterium sp. EYE_80]MCK6125356.1 aldose 1-epimerase family protein [Microbacterium sp. EYE_79]MCK6140276.1 aldose 1-epimerase family protein [Microbacterium sp. EYE_39]
MSDNDPTRGLPRLSHHELARRTGDLAAIAGVREVVLANGPEAGVRALQLRNASGLEVEILIDRAFDIGDVRLAGVPISWRSGNQYRHPALHEVESEDGLSWLRTLDGFLVSGGLDHTLFGGEYDATHYNYPPKETVRHGLHGRLSSLPARLLSVEEDWNEDGGELRVTGEVVQATAFGEHLRLRRTVAIGIHGTSIGIDDTVENLGFERTPHMFLYHLNVGWPVVDEGTRFLGRVEGHRWSSDSTADQGVPYDVLPEPQRGFVEQVWEHDLTPGADGLHRVGLVRADGALGVEVAWDATTMPAFFEWQNLRDGQYAVGLEPSSHHVAGEQAARDDGSMTWLEHGETREYRTEITILRGSAEVAAAEARIQGGAR